MPLNAVFLIVACLFAMWNQPLAAFLFFVLAAITPGSKRL